MTEDFESLFVAFDTDGIDGNTSAAGACANHDTVEVIQIDRQKDRQTDKPSVTESTATLLLREHTQITTQSR